MLHKGWRVEQLGKPCALGERAVRQRELVNAPCTLRAVQYGGCDMLCCYRPMESQRHPPGSNRGEPSVVHNAPMACAGCMLCDCLVYVEKGSWSAVQRINAVQRATHVAEAEP